MKYQNKEWLKEQIEVNGHTFQEIADMFGKSKQNIIYFAKKYGIHSTNPCHTRKGRFLGENSPLWRGGTHRYVYNWSNVAEEFKRISNYTCCKCGKRIENSINLHVHHIDGSFTNNHPSNILVVCRSCHQMIHSGRI